MVPQKKMIGVKRRYGGRGGGEGGGGTEEFRQRRENLKGGLGRGVDRAGGQNDDSPMENQKHNRQSTLQRIVNKL